MGGGCPDRHCGIIHFNPVALTAVPPVQSVWLSGEKKQLKSNADSLQVAAQVRQSASVKLQFGADREIGHSLKTNAHPQKEGKREQFNGQVVQQLIFRFAIKCATLTRFLMEHA